MLASVTTDTANDSFTANRRGALFARALKINHYGILASFEWQLIAAA
jgi:hypothetical protein